MNRWPWLLPWLLTCAPAQRPAWVDDLSAADPVTRELARRQLAIAPALPVAALVKVLQTGSPAAALAAATLLRDRHPERPELRAVPVADTPLFRAVLPVASVATLRQLVTGGPDPLRGAALYLLADRGQLTDAVLGQALRSPLPGLADAACRLVVHERSPFPTELVAGLATDRAASERLIGWLAERPRRAAAPFVERLLAAEQPLATRVLALQALPGDRIGFERAGLLLNAAAGADLAVGNRARNAAARLAAPVADRLVPLVVQKLRAGTPAYLLLPCLERVSSAGEKALLEAALGLPGELQADLFHWLSPRESRLVARYVGRALDGAGAIPPDLLRLASPALTTTARIDRVAALLADGPGAPQAYDALLGAQVYHRAMLDYAVADEFASEARRMRRLCELPLAILPLEVFRTAFASDSQLACIYAVNALARRPIPRQLEAAVIGFAVTPGNLQLQLSAARALLLWGSETAGRQAFAALRTAERGELAFRWLMERPKPWSYEILLRERERLGRIKTRPALVELHRVLIALARLGDRGAREQLVREIPRLAPAEMRELQTLMRKALTPSDLANLAERHLAVQPGDPEADGFHDADDRRVELLEWLLAEPGLDLQQRLWELWQKDRSYDLRLVALRGLLARGDAAFHAEIRRQLAQPFDEARQDLAFEVVGSMTTLPIPERSMELLAHIVLRCPLHPARAEVARALAAGDRGARSNYPLITPVVNLLRLDETARPGAVFERVAGRLGAARCALNRQRLGRFLAGLTRRDALLADLGPVVARLILAAPDASADFVGPARLVLADAALAAGDFAAAADHYRAASRAFGRGRVPDAIRQMFLGAADPVARYHPLAALAARAPLARARGLIGAAEPAAARSELLRARDLAEGDADTIAEIHELLKVTDR